MQYITIVVLILLINNIQILIASNRVYGIVGFFEAGTRFLTLFEPFVNCTFGVITLIWREIKFDYD